MDAVNLYDDDIYAWAEQQAAVLRRLAGLQGLPNELDLEHVVEEIADLGISELREVKSLIRLILTHLILIDMDGGADAIRHWRQEIITWRSALLDAITPAMRQRIDLDALWRRALHDAEIKYLTHHDTKGDAPRFLSRWPDGPCPRTLDEICADIFTLS